MALNEIPGALSNVRQIKNMFYFNFEYLLFALPGLLLGIWAQIRLHSIYSKYSEVPVESGQTGAETARRILDNAGLHDMPVEEVPGSLSDHYDPDETRAVSLLGQLPRRDRRRRRRGGARGRARAPAPGRLRTV